jgi:hypothetical protein
MWWCQSPPAPKGGSGTAGHMVISEPSPAGRQTQCHMTGGDVRALPHWEVGLKPWNTWWHRSPPSPWCGPNAMRHVVTLDLSHTGCGVWHHKNCTVNNNISWYVSTYCCLQTQDPWLARSRSLLSWKITWCTTRNMLTSKILYVIINNNARRILVVIQKSNGVLEAHSAFCAHRL